VVFGSTNGVLFMALIANDDDKLQSFCVGGPLAFVESLMEDSYEIFWFILFILRLVGIVKC